MSAVPTAPAIAPPISVLVLTRNEERNLPACLASVAWADDVVVFDSHSDDRTTEIAAEHGARVRQRVFDDFSSHKNWAMQNVDFKHEWLLILDADERVTPAVAAELARTVANPGDRVGFYLRYRMMWRGRPLRFGGRSGFYNLRLLRRGHGRYEQRLVHEHMVLDGPAGYLKEPLLHDDDKGLERYIDRHNHYSTLEAVELLRSLEGDAPETGRLHAALGAAPARRRRALKQWAYRHLPARPLFAFLYQYLFRLGFLDGRAGWEDALLRAIYEFHIDLKLRELRTPGSPLDTAYRRRRDDVGR